VEAVRLMGVVAMGSSVAARRLVITGLVGLLLVVGGAQGASAHRTALSVQILSEQALLGPDGGSMTFDLSTVCDRTWTIVQASVSVTQPQAVTKAAPITITPTSTTTTTRPPKKGNRKYTHYCLSSSAASGHMRR
jgi:hypothetical protein